MDLPRPDVTVDTKTTQDEGDTSPVHQVDVVVSRDNKARSYTGTGSTPSEAIKGAVRKIVDDRGFAEMLPEK